MIAVEHRYEYRKNADMYEAEDVGDIERLFDAYGINYLSNGAFTSPIPIEEARSWEEAPFYQWFLTQEPSFEELWEKLSDEAFHLLFGNRSFLLKFNRAVARYLEQETIVFRLSISAWMEIQATADSDLGAGSRILSRSWPLCIVPGGPFWPPFHGPFRPL